jgi:hypothetical protein
MEAPLADAVQQQGGEAAAAAAAAAAGAPLELPLYYIAGDRTRFAYAIFLLNKDLEQLLHAHGMSSYGPNQVLANLYKLMTAAASALPPVPRLPPQLPHSGGGAAADVVPRSVVAAAGDVGRGAEWLQQLPLPPVMQQQQGVAGLASHEQPAAGKANSAVQQQQQQPAPGKANSAVQQQPPVQDQQSSWSLWPWSRQQQQQQPPQQRTAQALPQLQQQQQQQQQQPSISTWDWNDLIG